jgi:deoxyribodipyrimidine photo-lyase
VQRVGEKGLVWLKRDLRVRDHAPLAAGQQLGAKIAVFIFEPAWIDSPECAAHHIAFAAQSLIELGANLALTGINLIVGHGDALAVLSQLHREHGFTHLLSHEETGSGWSYARDIAVAAWCQRSGVEWREYPQTGVIRRLRSRAGWAKRWAQRMDSPVATPLHAELQHLPSELRASPVCTAGEQAAWDTLRDFLSGRGRDYRRALSSPLTAESTCSRLSAHLAFGTISVRSVHQATEAAIKDYQAVADRGMAFALRGFSGRLRWHCHFMQKLEDEPEIEFCNFSRSTDNLRRPDYNAQDLQNFKAWCNGETGYPMVDACMRSLVATGWLNFRMRAMLVSFASYHLWLHWRQTGLVLARLFLDFEPGIHWSQMQMQSGTTGINTLRIYSPTKQARDHDPDGVFIRRWCPELDRVPLALLAEPWTMTTLEQAEANCVIGKDYPRPVVEEKTALKFAKEQLYGLRKTLPARQESREIQDKHGSRKGGLPATPRRAAKKTTLAKSTAPTQNSPQGYLF